MDEQHYQYRTGRTEPRKKHNGLIAALLICVIFLGGLISTLGLLNIRLSLQLSKGNEDNTPLSFSQADAQTPIQQTGGSVELEGMTIQELPAIYQKMYDLPQGLYICHVADGSRADHLGIAPGDVLTCFAGTPVSRLDALQSLLDAQKLGAQVDIVTYRDGQQNLLPLILDN